MFAMRGRGVWHRPGMRSMLAARQDMVTRPRPTKNRVAVMRCTHRRETVMFTIPRSRSLFLGSAVVLAFTLLAPVTVTAEEEEVGALAPAAAPAVVGTSATSVRAVAQALAAQDALLSGEMGSLQEEHLRAIVAAAPVAAPSWDETSGYGAVEASRATIDYPTASTSTAQTRVLTAQHALQGGDLGSMQEDALLAVVSAGQSWDEISGYGSVEASRAANAIPVAPFASTSQVPADVRWAPADTIGPASSRAVSPDYLPVALGTGTRSESVHLSTVALADNSVRAESEQTRVLAAQQALLSPDLGGLQEEALTAVVEASAELES